MTEPESVFALERAVPRTVMFVSHYPFYGGPQNRALRLYRPLLAEGWETVVVLPDEEGNARARLEGAAVPVRSIKLGRLRAVKDARVHVRFLSCYIADITRLRALIREHDAALVVVAGLANAQAAIAARLERKPLIWQVLDTRTPRPVAAAMTRLAVKIADVVMTTGNVVALAHPNLAALGERLIPFYSPVDTAEFAPAVDRATAKREVSLDPSGTVVGLVANITPQKGLENFIAMAETVGRLDSTAQFLVVGDSMATQLTYLSQIERLIAASEIGRQGRLTLRATGGSVARWLRSFDVFALSSTARSEGVPTAVLEALSCGVPVVGYDVGGVREVIRDGQTGYVVDSVEEAVEAVADLLAAADQRERFGKAAREDAVARFSTASSLATHLEAFDLALTHRRKR